MAALGGASHVLPSYPTEPLRSGFSLGNALGLTPSEALLSSSVSCRAIRLAQVFDWFDTKPLASGSIAQVHKAVLQGEVVAVKVRATSQKRDSPVDRCISAHYLKRYPFRVVRWEDRANAALEGHAPEAGFSWRVCRLASLVCPARLICSEATRDTFFSRTLACLASGAKAQMRVNEPAPWLDVVEVV